LEEEEQEEEEKKRRKSRRRKMPTCPRIPFKQNQARSNCNFYTKARTLGCIRPRRPQ
jgi:hypothetical protein